MCRIFYAVRRGNYSENDSFANFQTEVASDYATKTDLADCVRMPYVNAEIPANSTSVRVTASVPSGYSFIGWCYCSSLGWLGHVYASSNEATTVFYTSSGSSSSARRFNAFYLVLKNA